MGEKITVRQLAQRKGADPNFLLRKLQEFGLPHGSLDDIIDINDTEKMLQSMGRPKKTLSKRSQHSRTTNLSKEAAKSQSGLRHTKKAGAKEDSRTGAFSKNTTRHPIKNQGPKGDSKKTTKTTRSGATAKPTRSNSASNNKSAGRGGIKSGSDKHNKAVKFKEPSKDDKSAVRDKKPKSKNKGAVDLRQEKTTQRYGVKISDEDALEIEQVVKDQKVKDVSSNRRDAMQDKRATVEIENPHKFVRPSKSVAKDITISGDLPFATLAHKLTIKKSYLLSRLKKMGLVEGEQQHQEKDEIIIDREMAILVSEELGYNVTQQESEQDAYVQSFELPANTQLVARPPIVTIMGHVDHGKTTLLDYIRKSKQVDNEAGNITQHFGAYSVTVNKNKITFFDTPGHAAFSDMRARGAKLTDIVVLVVAADDGMKPQTIEAINHSKSANAEIVVAINKTDLDGADPEQLRKDLAGQGLQMEEWGGDVQFVEISAKSGKGVDKLLEAILAQASIMELKAGVKVPGRGYVIESKLDKAIGPSATIILQHGEIKHGDILVAGDNYGRIKLIKDDMGEQIKSADVAIPINILGLNGVPTAGDSCTVVKNEKEARKLIEFNKQQQDTTQVPEQVDIEKLLNTDEAEKIKINLIIKTDVTGSLEAIKGMVNQIDNEVVEFGIVSNGVGAVSESDVSLARATHAIIVGFNVRLDAGAKQEMKLTPVPEIHYYNVIYDLSDQLDKLLNENLALQDTEKVVGIALVKEVFSAKQYGQIAGCEVSEGIVHKDKPIRVLRDNKVIYEGVLESLRRFKENVKEVQQGVECGIGVKDYKNVKVGDQIEVFDRAENP